MRRSGGKGDNVKEGIAKGNLYVDAIICYTMLLCFNSQ